MLVDISVPMVFLIVDVKSVRKLHLPEKKERERMLEHLEQRR